MWAELSLFVSAVTSHLSQCIMYREASELNLEINVSAGCGENNLIRSLQLPGPAVIAGGTEEHLAMTGFDTLFF